MRALPLALHRALGLWTPFLLVLLSLGLLLTAAVSSALKLLSGAWELVLFTLGVAAWGLGIAIGVLVNNRCIGMRVVPAPDRVR